jgi:hypothetical protein
MMTKDPKNWLNNSDRQTLLTVIERVDTAKLFDLVSSLPPVYTGTTDWESFKSNIKKRMEPPGALVGPEIKARQGHFPEFKAGKSPAMTVDPSVKRAPAPGAGWALKEGNREANLKAGTHDPFTVKVPELAGQVKKKRDWEHEADTGIDEDSGEYGDAGSDWGI